MFGPGIVHREVNAYVVTGENMHVIEGADRLEVSGGDVMLIQGDHPERGPVAAVKLSDQLWVAIGDEPPSRLPQTTALSEQTPMQQAMTRDGGWPFEPPPDVDSER